VENVEYCNCELQTNILHNYVEYVVFYVVSHIYNPRVIIITYYIDPIVFFSSLGKLELLSSSL